MIDDLVYLEEFEVSPRTIVRDLESLDQAGIPIQSFCGVDGGYQIMDSFVLEKQVATSHEYLICLIISDQIPVVPFILETDRFHLDLLYLVMTVWNTEDSDEILFKGRSPTYTVPLSQPRRRGATVRKHRAQLVAVSQDRDRIFRIFSPHIAKAGEIVRAVDTHRKYRWRGSRNLFTAQKILRNTWRRGQHTATQDYRC